MPMVFISCALTAFVFVFTPCYYIEQVPGSVSYNRYEYLAEPDVLIDFIRLRYLIWFYPILWGIGSR